MFCLLLIYGIVYFTPRVILVRCPLDLISMLVILPVLLLTSDVFSEAGSRRLIALVAASMCTVYLVTLSRSAVFDMNLLGSFLFWFMVGISPALEEEPCNPLRTML